MIACRGMVDFLGTMTAGAQEIKRIERTAGRKLNLDHVDTCNIDGTLFNPAKSALSR